MLGLTTTSYPRLQPPPVTPSHYSFISPTSRPATPTYTICTGVTFFFLIENNLLSSKIINNAH